jgi:FtsP/CotA-like multicopper oxidase with cupredoxin domain
MHPLVPAGFLHMSALRAGLRRVSRVDDKNGKSWPFLNVEPRRYRFRFLDGSNARFLNMWLETDVKNPKPGPEFQVIGSDGGFLDRPSLQQELLMGPGERYDVIVDFSAYAGQDLILRNDGNMPFPDGSPVDPAVDGQIMQFRVAAKPEGEDDSHNPASSTVSLREASGLSPIPDLETEEPVTLVRQLTLNEEMGMAQTVDGVTYSGRPLAMFVNNTRWNGKVMEAMMEDSMLSAPDDPAFEEDSVGNHVSELPVLGTTEIWEIANLTADAHPIHLHLIQFQLLDRQRLHTRRYNKAYEAAFDGGGFDHMTGEAYPAGVYLPGDGPPDDYVVPNADGAIGGNPAFSRYLLGKASPAPAAESGWEDTITMYPGEVKRIAIRWADQDGQAFAFDATGSETDLATDENGKPAGGPGYVWHCHIVDHEDNEMMRPMLMK